MKRIICLMLSFLILMSFCSCNKKIYTDTRIMFDTVINITLYSNGSAEVLDKAFKMCQKYDKMLNAENKESDVYKINHSNGKSIKVNSDTAELIKKSLKYSAVSDGRFDITIYPVYKLWGFDSDKHEVPDIDNINLALKKVDYRNITVDGNMITSANNSQIDLGGIAKGFIADKVKNFLKEQNVTSATLNFGGNVYAIGSKDGAPFKIGIRDPESDDDSKTAATVKVENKTVVTSGTYQRFFKVDGVKYHHILNTSTGFPFESDLASVTIIGNSSVDEDALSTICFLYKKEKALKLIESISNTEAIFIDNSGKLTASSGLKKAGKAYKLKEK